MCGRPAPTSTGTAGTESKATELQFACNMPGHYEAGMVGKIDFQR